MDLSPPTSDTSDFSSDNPDAGPYLETPPIPSVSNPSPSTSTESPVTAPETNPGNAPPTSVTISIPYNAPAPALTEKEKKRALQEEKDHALANRIRNRIYQYSGGYAKTVDIVTQNGKVTLKGEVPEQTDRLYIERTARAEAGADNVKNELKTFREVRRE